MSALRLEYDTFCNHWCAFEHMKHKSEKKLNFDLRAFVR